VLLLLLVVLAGAGAFNYQRNLKAEQAQEAKRPLHGYAKADLEKLQAAYQQEVKRLEARYQAAKGSRSGVRDHELLGDQANEFARVTKESDGVREIGALLSEREAALREVQSELSQRTNADAAQIFLRRLTTF
jgi:hypothetical protein